MNDEERTALGKYLTARANGIRQELEEIDALLNILGKPYAEQGETATETTKPTQQEIEALKYTEQTSSKGPYRLVTKAENSDNLSFEKLQSYLKEKGGFSQIHGFKAWIFNQNPNKIGIRKQ